MPKNKKGRRSSILKTPKSRNPFSEIPPEPEPQTKSRRVSFANNNLVKPFTTDSETNTLWDSTYEESLSKSDQFEAAENDKVDMLNSTRVEEQDMSIEVYNINDENAVNLTSMDLTLKHESIKESGNKYNSDIVTQNVKRRTIHFTSENMDLSTVVVDTMSNVQQRIEPEDKENYVPIIIPDQYNDEKYSKNKLQQSVYFTEGENMNITQSYKQNSQTLQYRNIIQNKNAKIQLLNQETETYHPEIQNDVYNSQCDDDITKSIPPHLRRKVQSQKRNTIHFNEDIIPDQNQGSSNQPTVYYNQNNQVNDMELTEKLIENISSIQTYRQGAQNPENIVSASKRNTMHFHQNNPDGDMDLTDKMPENFNTYHQNRLQQQHIENDTSSQNRATSKRHTMLTHQNNQHADINLMQENFNSTQQNRLRQQNIEYINPHQNQATSKCHKMLIHQNNPEAHIDLTERMPKNFNTIQQNQLRQQNIENIVPPQNRTASKRHTMLFQQNNPEADMDLTEKIPENYSAMQHNRLQQQKTENISPPQNQATSKRRKILIHQNNPEVDMDLTERKPVNAFQQNRCQQNIAPPQNQGTSKRHTMLFQQNNPEADMDLTDKIPENFNATQHNRLQQQNTENNAPSQNQATRNRHTTLTHHNNPEADMDFNAYQQNQLRQQNIENIAPPENRVASKRHTMLFQQNNPEGDMDLTDKIPENFNAIQQNRLQQQSTKYMVLQQYQTTSNRHTMRIHENNPEADMDLTERIPEKFNAYQQNKLRQQNIENIAPPQKKAESKRHTMLFQQNNPEADMDLTDKLPENFNAMQHNRLQQRNTENNAPPQNQTTSNRHTTFIHRNNLEADVDLAERIPENMNAFQQNCLRQQNIENITPAQSQGTSKRHTMLFQQNNPEADMDLTDKLPENFNATQNNRLQQQTTENNAPSQNQAIPNRHRTLNHRNNPEADMDLTERMPEKFNAFQQNQLRQQNIENIVPSQNKATSKRHTMLFQQNNPEADMDLTDKIPENFNAMQYNRLQQRNTENNAPSQNQLNPNRYTTLIHQNNPEVDMSLTERMPEKFNAFQQNRLRQQNIENIAPSYEKTESKRHTMLFQQNNPDADMDLTDKIPENFNTMQHNRLPQRNTENNAPPQNQATRNRHTILTHHNNPEPDMDLTERIPEKFNAYQQIQLRQQNIENIAPPQKKTEPKRHTMLFQQNNSEADMDLTDKIPENFDVMQHNRLQQNIKNYAPSQNQSNLNRHTTLIHHNNQEADMDLTERMPEKFNAFQQNQFRQQNIENIAPPQKKAESKRHTMLFQQNNPDADMDLTDKIPENFNAIQHNRIRQQNIENIVALQNQESKCNTMLFQQNNLEADMEFTEKMPANFDAVQQNRWRQQNIGNIVPHQNQTTSKRHTILFQQNNPEADMDLTEKMPKNISSTQQYSVDTIENRSRQQNNENKNCVKIIGNTCKDIHSSNVPKLLAQTNINPFQFLTQEQNEHFDEEKRHIINYGDITESEENFLRDRIYSLENSHINKTQPLSKNSTYNEDTEFLINYKLGPPQSEFSAIINADTTSDLKHIQATQIFNETPLKSNHTNTDDLTTFANNILSSNIKIVDQPKPDQNEPKNIINNFVDKKQEHLIQQTNENRNVNQRQETTECGTMLFDQNNRDGDMDLVEKIPENVQKSHEKIELTTNKISNETNITNSSLKNSDSETFINASKNKDQATKDDKWSDDSKNKRFKLRHSILTNIQMNKISRMSSKEQEIFFTLPSNEKENIFIFPGNKSINIDAIKMPEVLVNDKTLRDRKSCIVIDSSAENDSYGSDCVFVDSNNDFQTPVRKNTPGKNMTLTNLNLTNLKLNETQGDKETQVKIKEDEEEEEICIENENSVEIEQNMRSRFHSIASTTLRTLDDESYSELVQNESITTQSSNSKSDISNELPNKSTTETINEQYKKLVNSDLILVNINLPEIQPPDMTYHKTCWSFKIPSREECFPDTSENFLKKHRDVDDEAYLAKLKESHINKLKLKYAYYDSLFSDVKEKQNVIENVAKEVEVVKELTVLEKIKLKSAESNCYWEIEKIEEEQMIFTLFYNTIVFATDVDQTTGMVKKIKFYHRLSDSANPQLKYIIKLYQKKFTKEHIQSSCGESYTILTLLDFITLLRQDMFKVEHELEDLNLNHFLKMDWNMNASLKFVSFRLTWLFEVSFNMFELDENISKNMNIEVYFGDILENNIRIHAKGKTTGYQFIKEFVNTVNNYIAIKEKDKIKK